MVKRKIIKINEDLCNGCGLCIPECPEGALQIIDGKVRLISDLFCDGLGACLGHCPQGAIETEEREAQPYDENKVMENIIKQGPNTIRAHLEHLKDHGEMKFLKQAIEFLEENNIPNPLEEESKSAPAPLPCGCPGTMMRSLKKEDSENYNNELNKCDDEAQVNSSTQSTKQSSELQQWPIQLRLLPVQAPFFEESDLLIAADCVGFAYPNFHSELLQGKSVVIGCPKLDDLESYDEKLTEIFKHNNIKSITVAIMEVPCCYGLKSAVEDAITASGKNIPLTTKVISLGGEIN
ncbi:4Fe-4S binding protein [Candidatus Woesearchaeota archaeon]|jgi:ferredoxin|nr:4Fe-4S binding protein [Candidatus Woesearchaeota archaeon]MBT6519608.1 4Fe-4S binding protein [Candidatus Woesearchaeota archaeon]MBT7367523.1 4Fe-4S binding protein [Candidatus Woesearchaeota archaeon]